MGFNGFSKFSKLIDDHQSFLINFLYSTPISLPSMWGRQCKCYTMEGLIYSAKHGTAE